MAIPIEGYSVLAQKPRIQPHLDAGAVDIPNRTALADDDIWRCCFMEQSDALKFIQQLQNLGLNTSQGPDSDVVLVNEFDQSVDPYCEWLATAQWEKAVIGWKAGTEPDSVTAMEGWDPKVGSGLQFGNRNDMEHLEFLRLEGNVEVYRDKQTGEEVYLGRTSTPVEALFQTASETISQHFLTVGEPHLTGESAEQVAQAVAALEQVLAESPDAWNVLWFHGKGQLALGNIDQAYDSFHRAFSLEKQSEDIPRELAGVCLELGKFDEAVAVAEQAVSLVPDRSDLIGNLGLAYLLAGRLDEAQKSISAALKLDASDQINAFLQRIIAQVASGERPQPTSMAELTGR